MLAVAPPPGWDELLLAGRCTREELVIHRLETGSFGLGLDDSNVVTESKPPLQQYDIVLAVDGRSIVGSKLTQHVPSDSSMVLTVLRLKPDTSVKDLVGTGIGKAAGTSPLRDLLSPRSSGRKRNMVRPAPLVVPPKPVDVGRRRESRLLRKAAIAPYRSPRGVESHPPSLGNPAGNPDPLGSPTKLGSPSGLTPTMQGASLHTVESLVQELSGQHSAAA